MEPITLPWQRYNDPERKRKFAALARVRPATPAGRFEAACLTFPDQEDDNLARMAAEEYPYDRVVIEEMARLEAVEPEAGLPSRAEVARDVFNMAKDASKSVEDRLKCYKTYADLMGYIQKPSDKGVNIFNNSRIMVMPSAPASVDSWEETASAHQARLVGNASTT